MPGRYTTLKMEARGTDWGPMPPWPMDDAIDFTCSFRLAWINLTNALDIVPKAPCACSLKLASLGSYYNKQAFTAGCACVEGRVEGFADTLPEAELDITLADVVTLYDL